MSLMDHTGTLLSYSLADACMSRFGGMVILSVESFWGFDVIGYLTRRYPHVQSDSTDDCNTSDIRLQYGDDHSYMPGLVKWTWQWSYILRHGWGV